MKVLCFLAVLVIIIVVLLFIPFTATLKISEKTDFTVRYLCFKLYPLKGKNKKGGINSEKKPKNNGNHLKKMIDKKGFAATVSDIIFYLKTAVQGLGSLLEHIKINGFSCYVNVFGNDAAATALEYGAICTAVYGFSAFLASVTDFNYNDITVNSDFDGEKGAEFRLYSRFKVKPIIIVAVAVRALYRIILEKKDVLNNGRKSH